MKQNGIQHASEDETFATKQVLQKLIGPQMYSVLSTLNKSCFQLCQKPYSFAASAQNLCLFFLLIDLHIFYQCFKQYQRLSHISRQLIPYH